MASFNPQLCEDAVHHSDVLMKASRSQQLHPSETLIQPTAAPFAGHENSNMVFCKPDSDPELQPSTSEVFLQPPAPKRAKLVHRLADTCSSLADKSSQIFMQVLDDTTDAFLSTSAWDERRKVNT